MSGKLVSPLEVNGQEVREGVAKQCTIDANLNTILNLAVSHFAGSAVTTVMPVTPTDTTFSTTKAIKDYIKLETDKLIAGSTPSGTIVFTAGHAPFPTSTIPGQTWLIAGLTGNNVGTLGTDTGPGTTIKVMNGDILKSKVVSAGGEGVAADFYAVEGNRSQASVTDLGLVIMSDPATATWTNADTTTATSPAYVSNAIADYNANRPSGFYSTAMNGVTTLTVTAATHGLGADGAKLTGDLIDSTTGEVYPLARPVISPTTGTAVITTSATITGATLRLYRLG